VLLEALDTAAAGKLTAEARKLRVRARYAPANTYSLTIPWTPTTTALRIAGEWKDLDPGADEETVKGQDTTGDGMTVEQEYRVCLAGREEKGLPPDGPQFKELFLIDEGGIFDTAVWRRPAGSRRGSWMNPSFSGADPRSPASWTSTPTPAAASTPFAWRPCSARETPATPQAMQANGLYGGMAIKSPKDVKACRVFKDRIRATLNELFLWLGKR